MDTKLKGDIAEQSAICQVLKRGWTPLRPIGDRLPYDLVFDVSGRLVRIQVKSAWLNSESGSYVVDNRRTKTNRRIMKRDSYSESDFEFALIYLEQLDIFYIMPVEVFISYGSQIHIVESSKRQRKPRSAEFREAWHLISQWAAQEETPVRTPVKFGEAFQLVIPSQVRPRVGKV